MASSQQKDQFSNPKVFKQLMVLSDLQGIDCMKKAVDSFIGHLQCGLENNNDAVGILRLLSVLGESNQVPSDVADDILLRCCLPVLSDGPSLDSPIFGACVQCLSVLLKFCSVDSQNALLLVHIKLLEKYADDATVSYGGASHAEGEMSLECLMSVLNIVNKNATPNSEAYMMLINHCTKLIDHVSDDVAGKLVGSLIPKTLSALDTEHQKTQLQSLWKSIVTLYEDNCNERLYLMLCGLADFYFPVAETKEPLVNLIELSIFWDILQSGLCQLSPMTRKIALYLLKRILDVTETENQDISIDKTGDSSKNAVFWWISSNKKQLSAVWQDFILLMETLEEKQVHVIRPILPRFENLVKATTINKTGSSLIHTSWVACVVRRTAVHESLYLKRWGATAMLSIDVDQCPLLDQGGIKFLESQFVDIITESSLYYRLPEMNWDQCPPVVDWLTSFLQKVFSKLSVESGCSLWEKLFEKLCDDTCWNSSSMMYIMKAFSALPKQPLWKKSAVAFMRELLVSCIRTMDTYIRGALQSYLLKTFFNLLDWNSATLEDFATALSYINSSESLQRGSPSWQNAAKFLNSVVVDKAVSAKQILEYCSSTIGSILKQPEEERSKILPAVRFMLIAADADLLHSETSPSSVGLKSCLQPVFDVLTSVNTHAYMPPQKAETAVMILTTLLSEATPLSGGQGEDVVMAVLKELLKSCQNDVFLFVERQLKENLSEVKDLERISTLNEVISGMFAIVPTASDASFYNLAKACIMKVTDEVHLKKIGAMIVLSTLYTCAQTNGLGQENVLESFFADWTPQKILKPRDDNRNNLDKTWGLMIEAYMAAQWSAIHKYFSQKTLSDQICEENAGRATEMLDLVSGPSVISVLKSLALFMPQVSEDTYSHTVECCWRKIRELTKTSFFWPAYEEYISLAVTAKSLSYENGRLQEAIATIFEMGEEKQGLVIVLVNRLCELYDGVTVDSQLETVADVFMKAVGYGIIHGRGKRFLLDVKVYLNTEKDLSVNHLIDGTKNMDRLVQAKVLSHLAKLKGDNPRDVKFGKMLFARIRENLIEKMNTKKYRNYSNTQCHREKHRNILAVAVLVGFLENDKEFQKDFHAFLMEVLLGEDQPSVRSYAELFLTKLCHRNPSVLMDLQKEFDDINEKRTSCFCSLMIVVTHVGRLLEDKDQLEQFLLVMMPKIFPLCMVYPVNLRTFGQVTVLDLWTVAKKRNLTKVMESNGILESFNLFHSVAGHQHACRTTLHLLDNFMMHIDPVSDWNMETLAFQLPRLTQLVDDEWISAEMFEKMDPEWRTHPEKFSVALKGSRNVLQGCSPGTWRIKNSYNSEEDAGEGDVQKKIQPWRTMLPSEDSEVQEDYARKRQNAGQLVLVTSLIDKPANLGGLCRTSEIFGVSEFVIGKLKYVTDKTFESLCVTANKWVPITEVRPHDLKDYLLLMKQEGYTLVGVEQTANSENLVDYKFPVKTLLLLGNEKEGIPANLLQLLDVCVEIPQAGIIRSLNVHVSGALLIWSYAQQHLFAKS